MLCKQELAEAVDKGCPTVLGGPLPHAIAAKAVAFTEALRPEYRTYAARIVQNAQALASACMAEGMDVLTGGTDNHLMLIDIAKTFGLTGRQGESALRACGFTLNRNAVPFDPNGPWYTSGLRIGTPATTTLGMGADEMKEIARIMKRVLSNTTPAVTDGKKSQAKYNLDNAIVEEAHKRVQALLDKHPLYPELDLEVVNG